MKKLIGLMLLSLVCSAQTKAKVFKTSTGHSVSLSCTPVSGTGTVTGCYFYKGTTSNGESTTALNPSPSLTYTDTVVSALQTYYYKAASYCTTCSPNLSGLSNEVIAAIPADPQPAPPVLSLGTVAKNEVPLMWQVPLQDNVEIVSFNIFKCQFSTCPDPPKIAQTADKSYIDTCKSLPCWYQVSANDVINNKFVTSKASNIVEARN